ncbi:hypothetical protein RFI_02863, partial [Reticulomyxa filosa]
MARFYADISKRYDKLFDKDTYHLNRAVNVNVTGDKVNWTLEAKADANNKVDSKLTVKHELFERENFQLETSVTKNPKFILTSTRLPFAKTKFRLLCVATYFFLIFIYFFILSGGVLFSPFTEEGGGKRRKVLLLFFIVSEPKAEVEFSNQLDKVAWSVKVGSNWKSAAMEADSSVAYKVVDNVTLGAKFSVEKEALKTAFGIKDYNFKFEWQRNSDQTL